MVISLEEDKDCRSYLGWTAQSRPTSPSPQKQVGRQSIQLETHDVDQQSKDILGHRENRRQRHPANSEYRQLCVDRPTLDEASLSPPIMIGHPRIDQNYLQENDCSINLCLWNAGRSGQRQREALLILHGESFNNGMRLDWESSQHLHGTSQRESIVMETSTLPIQSLLPTKFAGLSPTLRCVIQRTQSYFWESSPTLTRHSWIALMEVTFPFPCFIFSHDNIVCNVLVEIFNSCFLIL